MKQKIYISHLLQKTNITYTLLLIIFNIATFSISASNKTIFITFSIFFACLTFFLYRLKVINLVNKNWLAVKKEILYINYPYTVLSFFILLFVILGFNIYHISTINQDALNTTFIFSYFMSTLSMLLPSILLLVYMYLICPAFVIPTYEGPKKNRKRKTDILVLLIFLTFIIYSGVQLIQTTVNALTFSTREKFRAVKLQMEYPRKYLKYKDLSDYTVQKLQREKVDVPFIYTSEGFKFKTYEEAEKFCHSLNGEVANNLEIYNIIFNRFDTFGEKYYWTSNKAGRYNLLLHFKNMSYEIVKAPKGIKPTAYCTSQISKNNKIFDERYFFRTKPVEIEKAKIKVEKKDYTYPPLDIEKTKVNIPKQLVDDTIKHVNFNVKEVSQSYFNELLNKGYDYSPKVKVNAYYASDERMLQSSLVRDTNMKNIRLCYYPFMEYENMNMRNEAQIWQQSFCSPSFNIVSVQPVLKNKHEKDAYCYSHGGHIPNIPELMGIIKTFNMNSNGIVYWTNNKMSDYTNGGVSPVAVEVRDGRFVIVKPIPTLDKAYTFCVSKPKVRSQILANFKSSYKGINGKTYANKICPSCKYYEVPDTVLQQTGISF